MGSINILITEVWCPNCGKKSQARIQFKFGNTWQLEYKIGDTITWGGNDIGRSDLGIVKLYGIIESTVCPLCNKDSFPEEYDIFVEDNVIKSVLPMQTIQHYLDGNGKYFLLNN